jgi:H+-translocating NAD(P) transhydrogenase subunit alpha
MSAISYQLAAISHAGLLASADGAGKPAADGAQLTTMLFVFMLATFIGFEVIKRVSPLLHTPLMSLTNAISAIAIVGSITITGTRHSTASVVLGFIAIIASTTNLVSGFLITDRMLKMFKRREPKQS